MTPKYVIVLESSDTRQTANDLIFDDDVQALIERAADEAERVVLGEPERS